MSQNEQILKFLKAGNTINPRQALNYFGTMRLSARIHDLKGKGHKIASKLIKVNEHTEVAQYRLEA